MSARRRVRLGRASGRQQHRRLDPTSVFESAHTLVAHCVAPERVLSPVFGQWDVWLGQSNALIRPAVRQRGRFRPWPQLGTCVGCRNRPEVERGDPKAGPAATGAATSFHG